MNRIYLRTTKTIETKDEYVALKNKKAHLPIFSMRQKLTELRNGKRTISAGGGFHIRIKIVLKVGLT